MADRDQTTSPELPNTVLNLAVAVGKTGLVYITADDPRGLLIARHSLAEALADVPGALADLRAAGAPMPKLEGLL